MHHAAGSWHRFEPCRCCLTAALDVLFETLLLEFCCRIVVFRLPALLFPWQFQHQRLSRNSTKAKVNGQTALFYAANKVRVKQIRGLLRAGVVRRDAVEGFTVPCCISGRSC